MTNDTANSAGVVIAKVNAATMLVAELIKARTVATNSTNLFSSACDAGDAFNAVYDAIDAKIKQQ